MAVKKINYLRDMRINEVSLVPDPACPGAVVLFTKKNEAIADAVVKAGFDANEPRDEHGRWIAAAREKTRKAAHTLSSHARRLATAVAQHHVLAATGNRLVEGVSQGTAHIASAIKTTKPAGAFPVTGGGIQFNFTHTLADNSVLQTSVQLRPEHLPVYDRAVRGKEGNVNIVQGSALRTALDAVHRVLLRGGKTPVPSFAGGTKPDFLSYRRTMPQAQSSFSSYGGNSNTVTNRPAPAPLSTETGGVRRTAPQGVPEYVKSEFPPQWVKDAYAQRPPGHAAKDEENYPVPLPGEHTARTAGGWAYDYKGAFIPGGRPDVQEHMQTVHDSLANSQEMRAIRIRQMAENVMPARAGGRAHFSPEGWYIPHGTENEQKSIRLRYQNEADRREAIAERSPTSHVPAPANLFKSPGSGGDPLKEADEAIGEYLRHHGLNKIAPGVARYAYNAARDHARNNSGSAMFGPTGRAPKRLF